MIKCLSLYTLVVEVGPTPPTIYIIFSIKSLSDRRIVDDENIFQIIHDLLHKVTIRSSFLNFLCKNFINSVFFPLSTISPQFTPKAHIVLTDKLITTPNEPSILKLTFVFSNYSNVASCKCILFIPLITNSRAYFTDCDWLVSQTRWNIFHNDFRQP